MEELDKWELKIKDQAKYKQSTYIQLIMNNLN